MVYFRFTLWFLALTCFGIGCSEQMKSGSSRVTLKMPEQLQRSKAGGIQALAANACFAVNIMADDIPSTSNTDCDQAFGTFGGLVPAGGTIALEVNQGEARTVELYYVLSDNGCQPFDINQGLAKTFGANKVHRIARMTGVDMNEPEMTLEILMQLPSDDNQLANLFSAPATCLKAPNAPSPQAIKPARVVLGAGKGTTANGSIINVRVLDQKIDLQNIGGTIRLKPNRLGDVE